MSYFKRGEIQNQQDYPNTFEKKYTKQMELPGNLSEQIVFNTRPKVDEQMPIVIDESTLEENLSQPPQTN